MLTSPQPGSSRLFSQGYEVKARSHQLRSLADLASSAVASETGSCSESLRSCDYLPNCKGAGAADGDECVGLGVDSSPAGVQEDQGEQHCCNRGGLEEVPAHVRWPMDMFFT